MLSAAPTPPPPPPPPPVRTDTGVVEPDEQWKADLRKRIEHDLLHMVEDAQIIRDTILNSQPSERSRERAQRDYEESMNNIRTLAQDEFTRRLRQEMSERKWALDSVVSNVPDVARQQQWILDNIRKADEDEEREYGELGESVDEEGEVGEEVDHKPWQSRPPSRPSVSMTQPFRSKSPVSRRNVSSHQRQPPNPQPAEDNDDDDADDPHRHPPWRHESRGSQPYHPGGAPRRQTSGSQAFVRPPFPRAPEPSGISRTFAHANGQARNTGPVQFQRRGSVNSFPTAPRAIPGARPSLDEAVRFPTSASPGSRAIYAMQRSPEDIRQGTPIPRGPPTPEEGPRGISWSSLNSRRPLGDFSVHRRQNSKGEQRLPPVDGDLSDATEDSVLDDRQSIRSMRGVRSVMSIEQLTAWWETEARRKEEEANRKEEEASKKEEEARRLEENARQSLEEARRLEACARQAEASAKMREAAAQNKEAEVKHKEAEAKKREATSQKREAEAQRKEEDARHREFEARRKEKEVRKKEDEVRHKMEEARRRKEEDKRTEEEYERKKREIERKEAELKKREAELLHKENAARLAQEEAAHKALETSRLEPEEPSPIDEDTSQLEAEEATRADASNRAAEEQRSKADEKNRQRDELRNQQQQHHDEILRQRAKVEQQREFQRREALYYPRTMERERHISASSTFSSSAGSMWSSRPHTTNTSFTSSIPFSTTPKPSPTTGVRAGTSRPGTSSHAPKLDETDLEWARRVEERARQQQEQFKREQVRLESERQANLKSSKMSNRLYDSHENKWRQLRDSNINNLGGNSFAKDAPAPANESPSPVTGLSQVISFSDDRKV
jgi:hypothetical protein